MTIAKDKETTEIKRKAEAYFSKGSLKKALEEFGKLKELLPKDMRIVQKIADIHHKLGNFREAKQFYKMAAEYFTKEGFWAKAVALNKVIINLDPDDKDVQKQIADIYTSKGLSGQKLVLMAKKPKAQAKAPRDAVIDLAGAESVEEKPSGTMPEETGQKGSYRVPLFSALKAEAMNELIEKLALRRIPSGEIICRDGDPGDSMFVISEGWIEIFIEPDGGKRTTITSLKDGDFFGEFGLLTDGRRHASALAKTDAVLLEITARNFDELAKKHPNVPLILNDYFNTRMFDNVLRKSALFESLFSEERFEVLKQFKSCQFTAGSFIFKENDRGDRIFFIKNGDAEISIDRKGDKVVVAKLSTGDFFGETALLTDKPRTASVRAVTNIDLLYLDRGSFKGITAQYRHVEKKLQMKMEERAKDTIEAYKSHEEMKRCLGMV